MLRIYNTLTGKKEKLVPVRPGELGIYVCGMTVYDYCHLGHARVMVAFDTVVRYLRHRGYKVTYVRNITDIDDKIIARANELNEPVEDVTNRFIKHMHADLAALNVGRPDHEPKATEYIAPIIEMIETLIERGFAYPAENGDVYYRTRRFDGYGQLSGKRIDELRIGARIEPGEAKDDPLDFVLWKSSKPNEPWWESPWGRGRPGWHIECSAMSTCLLGTHFDIHAGGMDLLFPHHENEIAQSVGATGDEFANVWMHNGYLQIDAEKMSKSLKNFLTIREILARDRHSQRMGEVLRYMFLASHYRSPLNYSDEGLENARAALRRIYVAMEKAGAANLGEGEDLDDGLLGSFHEAMEDDFNTADALAAVFEGVRGLNRDLASGDSREAGRKFRTVRELASVLGLHSMPPGKFLGGADGDDSETVQKLIDERRDARGDRDWKRADAIRAELDAMGIELEDRADGATIWRRLNN